MQAVAFYLPQFHVIPENEAVYGKNFTEWDNVRNAKPLFPGHLQPMLPHKTIGYYDLLDPVFLQYQHDLAYDNGVQGFCYYYYNFGDKILLDQPLKLINESKTIKNNFCLCWAHPSWYNNRSATREVFVEHTFSEAHARNIFRDLLQYFTNDRYIRVMDKPLLAIFAPERCPMMREYATIWRDEARKHGLPGLWLAGVEAFWDVHPAEFGFDSMIEFAPDWHKEAIVSPPDSRPIRFDYAATIKLMCGKDLPDYTLMRCAFPGWDNTPRRGDRGVLAVGTSPGLFQAQVEFAAEYTHAFLPEPLQYFFINAWNEWGEGCCLEPDKRTGFANLHIVRDVMRRYA